MKFISYIILQCIPQDNQETQYSQENKRHTNKLFTLLHQTKMVIRQDVQESKNQLNDIINKQIQVAPKEQVKRMKNYCKDKILDLDQQHQIKYEENIQLKKKIHQLSNNNTPQLYTKRNQSPQYFQEISNLREKEYKYYEKLTANRNIIDSIEDSQGIYKAIRKLSQKRIRDLNNQSKLQKQKN